MRNKLEHFLLLILLAISVLLGLSFWLNNIFNFNLFCKAHWDELARLQVSHTPITLGFYVSIVIAILIFLICTYVIFYPTNKHASKKTPAQPTPVTPSYIKPEQSDDTPVPVPVTQISRPPRLKLPSNMAEIAAQRQIQNQQQQKTATPENNPYTEIFAQIFSDNGYTVKPNPKIAGFTPNLFAICVDEIVWIGASDADINKMHIAIEKLQSVFQETLEDIKININAFILDTTNQYQSDDSILIFKSVDELKKFISENPANEITDDNSDNFDAYSEYIDTIIQYVKNI